MKESVYLVGCRATGKSSIGKKLAKKLSYDYLDTDTMVTGRQGQSVAEIVIKDGWQQFRKYEKEALQELQTRQQCVVATGGGAIVHSELWPQLKKQGKVIWLTASLDVLCDRIRNDQQTKVLRPSLTGKDVCKELEDILKERSHLYEAAADCTIDTGFLNVVAAVTEIEKYLME
jgi:shikimate kinase